MKYLYKTLKILFALLLIVALAVFLFSANIKNYIFNELEEYSGFGITIQNIDLNYNNGSFFIFFNDIIISNSNDNIIAIKKSNININIFKPTELSVLIDDIVLFTDKIDYSSIDFDYDKLFYYIKVINIKKTKIYYKDKFVNLTNSLIYYNKSKLYFYLLRQDLAINEVFSNKLSNVLLDAKLDLTALKNYKLLLDISFSNNDLKTYLSLTTDNNYLHLSQKIDKLDAKILKNYIPDKILPEKLVYWLSNAFKSGNILDTTINLDIPIVKSVSPSLSVISSLEDLELNFANNWPNILKLNGVFKANLNSINIDLINAYIGNLFIKKSIVAIDIANSPILSAQIFTNSPSQHLGQFITINPMLEFIPNIHHIQLSGSATSKILLNISLANIDTSVIVNTKLINNKVILANSSLSIANIDADMKFTNNTIDINASGNIGKNPIKFDINNNNNKININASSNGLKFNITTAYDNKLNREYKLYIVSQALQASASIYTYDDNSMPLVVVNNAIITKGEIGIKYIDFNPEQVPNMLIKANSVMVDDYFLPSFSLKTERASNSILFKKGSFNENKLLGSFNGKWSNKSTNLNIDIRHGKLSELLQEIGLKDPVKGGKFKVIAHAICHCNPWDINLNNIVANASITVEEGVFYEKDASIGRVLSLLNIKAIAKRLYLDVSDVVGKGFEYETITANLSLNKSYLNINNFNLHSLSSDIDITGGVDMDKYSLDLKATVIPSIADSVPLLTYLGSGNAIGLGVWLTDKLLFDGNILEALLNKTVSFDYIITGSISSPTIN